MLSFDPASMGLTALGAKVLSSQQSTNLADKLQLIKDMLSAPINTLVDDSGKIKEILEQIESQLPESLRVKLWPAGHLPFLSGRCESSTTENRNTSFSNSSESRHRSQVQDAQPEESNSGCQNRYLREYKVTQSPGERTGGTRRKGPHHPRNNRANTGRVRRDKHLESTDSNRR